VLRLIRQLVSAEPVPRETNLAAALEYLNRVQKRRAVVFLISDFLAPAARHAMAVANKHHDLVAVTVSDPREQAMPDVGFITLRDAENRADRRGRYESSARARTVQEPLQRSGRRTLRPAEEDRRRSIGYPPPTRTIRRASIASSA